MKMTAIDLSDSAISILKQQSIPNTEFICADFVNQPDPHGNGYDYAYSRFTIHSINQTQERVLLRSIFGALRHGGKFFVEVRSIHDPLFGRGEALERNAFFYDTHYRRFIVLDELKTGLQEFGFQIEYAQEKIGFAPYGNDDPPVIRIVAKKP